MVTESGVGVGRVTYPGWPTMIVSDFAVGKGVCVHRRCWQSHVAAVIVT